MVHDLIIRASNSTAGVGFCRPTAGQYGAGQLRALGAGASWDNLHLYPRQKSHRHRLRDVQTDVGRGADLPW